MEKCSALLVFVRARILGHWTVLFGVLLHVVFILSVCCSNTGRASRVTSGHEECEGVRPLWGPQAWVSLLSYLGGTGYH